MRIADEAMVLVTMEALILGLVVFILFIGFDVDWESAYLWAVGVCSTWIMLNVVCDWRRAFRR